MEPPRTRAEPQPPADLALLRALIEDVTGADGRRYGLRDDSGREMHCAKIVADLPPGPGREHGPGRESTAPDLPGYLAVYHSTLGDGRFHVSLATSCDLLHWRHVRDFGPGGSQPTIAPVAGGGFLVAWEQDPRNHIAVRYFASRDELAGGRAARSYDARRSLSRCAEGTPNVVSVSLSPDIDHSVITFGGHYWWNCDRDRQLVATLTDFRRWRARPRPALDAALLAWGVGGNIGGRDPITFRGHLFGLIEGQHVKRDFGSWRTYVYDDAAGAAWPAMIRTDGGSGAFANPHITELILPSGRRGVVVSLFLPGEGAASAEGGQLVYFRAYPDSDPVV
ncbi:MAG: hypothetical protein ACRDVE_10970 [Actinocrinis sp.]